MKSKIFLNLFRIIIILLVGMLTSCDSGKYTVKFNSNKGTIVESQKIEEGKKLEQVISPTKEGYFFDGWYKEKTFENRWNFKDDVVIKNITLYAKWKAVESIPVSDSKDIVINEQIVFSYTALKTGRYYFTTNSTNSIMFSVYELDSNLQMKRISESLVKSSDFDLILGKTYYISFTVYDERENGESLFSIYTYENIASYPTELIIDSYALYSFEPLKSGLFILYSNEECYVNFDDVTYMNNYYKGVWYYTAIIVPLNAGQTYYFQTGLYNRRQGEFKLNIEEYIPPALENGNASVSIHGGYMSFTPNEDGAYQFNTESDLEFEVYDTENNLLYQSTFLNTYSIDDDIAHNVILQLSGGTTYIIKTKGQLRYPYQPKTYTVKKVEEVTANFGENIVSINGNKYFKLNIEESGFYRMWSTGEDRLRFTIHSSNNTLIESIGAWVGADSYTNFNIYPYLTKGTYYLQAHYWQQYSKGSKSSIYIEKHNAQTAKANVPLQLVNVLGQVANDNYLIQFTPEITGVYRFKEALYYNSGFVYDESSDNYLHSLFSRSIYGTEYFFITGRTYYFRLHASMETNPTFTMQLVDTPSISINNIHNFNGDSRWIKFTPEISVEYKFLLYTKSLNKDYPDSPNLISYFTFYDEDLNIIKTSYWDNELKKYKDELSLTRYLEAGKEYFLMMDNNNYDYHSASIEIIRK